MTNERNARFTRPEFPNNEPIRVLCGEQNCRGDFGSIRRVPSLSDEYLLIFEPSYYFLRPGGVWAVSKRALKKHKTGSQTVLRRDPERSNPGAKDYSQLYAGSGSARSAAASQTGVVQFTVDPLRLKCTRCKKISIATEQGLKDHLARLDEQTYVCNDNYDVLIQQSRQESANRIDSIRPKAGTHSVYDGRAATPTLLATHMEIKHVT